jgi:hypothetical protein
MFEETGTPVVVYDAEVRVAGLWTHAPRLVVRLDRGEPCESATAGAGCPRRS